MTLASTEHQLYCLFGYIKKYLYACMYLVSHLEKNRKSLKVTECCLYLLVTISVWQHNVGEAEACPYSGARVSIPFNKENRRRQRTKHGHFVPSIVI